MAKRFNLYKLPLTALESNCMTLGYGETTFHFHHLDIEE